MLKVLEGQFGGRHLVGGVRAGVALARWVHGWGYYQ